MIWSGKTEQEGRNFRLYDLEVLELSNDVSFLVVLPPVESVCNSPFDGPGQSAFSRECTYVPVQAFEMRKYTYRYSHQTTISINNNNNNMESVAVKLVKASSQFWPVHYNKSSAIVEMAVQCCTSRILAFRWGTCLFLCTFSVISENIAINHWSKNC